MANPENAECIGHARNNKCLEGAYPSELRHDDEGRNERKLRGRHHCGEQQDKQPLFAWKLEFCERKASQGIEEQDQQGTAGGHEQRVKKSAEEIDVIEHPRHIANKMRPEPKLWREAVNFRRRTRSHDGKPVKRKDGNDKSDNQSDIEQDGRLPLNHAYHPVYSSLAPPP